MVLGELEVDVVVSGEVPVSDGEGVLGLVEPVEGVVLPLPLLPVDGLPGEGGFVVRLELCVGVDVGLSLLVSLGEGGGGFPDGCLLERGGGGGAVVVSLTVVPGGVGTYPAKNWTLDPVPWGKEAVLGSVLASLNATVAFAVSVQEQNDPGWRVDGLPSCEQAAQMPSLLSQRVRAIHGWSGTRYMG